MKIRSLSALLALLILGCGCVSYKYEQAKPAAAPRANQPNELPFFLKKEKVPCKYTVLGTANVSGNYQAVSRDRLTDKLNAEARKQGADAILLLEQAIVPDGEATTHEGASPFASHNMDNDSNVSWSNLTQDVDRNYGNIRHKQDSAVIDSRGFKRIIRVQYIRYDK